MAKYGFRLCIVWLCPQAALAMADPADIFQPYVSDTVTYIDNLFYQNSQSTHVSVDPKTGVRRIKDDVMNQATVGSSINYPLGRQMFRLNLNVTDNRFVNNTSMDNISSKNRAAWNWQLGSQLSGEVGYAYMRAMGGFANTSYYGLNIITNNNPFATLNYTWHPRWKARANLSWQEYSNSASERQVNNQQYATALTGLDYTLPTGNSLGLQYSFTDGKYPNRELTQGLLFDNKYQQHSINALSTWKITEKIRFNGNVGYIFRINPDYSKRDYNSETFDLTLNWMPTVKTMVALSGFRRLMSYADVTDNFVIQEGFSVSPMWQQSPKLALSAQFMYQTWSYSGDPGLTITPLSRRQDTIMNGQVSLVYKPVPNAEVTLGYMGAKRDSVNPANYPYDYLVNSVFSSFMLKF